MAISSASLSHLPQAVLVHPLGPYNTVCISHTGLIMLDSNGSFDMCVFLEYT